uniref:Uncharacterized protein n=1 Tax=Avena sativa TaxID=4498 RepID=A0ACD5W649_AVESA
MKALGWNCQGMGKSLGSVKMSHLARMIYSTKPQVTFVSEIKSSKVKSSDHNARFNMYNSFVVPSRRRSGGLWMMWSDDLEVTVHSSSFYVILATAVYNTTNQKFGLVCIYGDPYDRQTSQIWNDVAAFVYDNPSIPMLCIGDMNELFNDMDKNLPNINRSRMYAFRSFVKNCGLFDLGFSGPAYTWTNKHFSYKPTFERLDRCLDKQTLFRNGVMLIPFQMFIICRSFMVLVITLLFFFQLKALFIELKRLSSLKIGG